MKTHEEIERGFEEEVCEQCKQDEPHEIKKCKMTTHLINPHFASSYFRKEYKEREEALVKMLKAYAESAENCYGLKVVPLNLFLEALTSKDNQEK